MKAHLEGSRVYLFLGFLGLVLFFVNSLIGSAAQETTPKGQTVMGIEDAFFTLNGQPTFLLGMSYYGAVGAPERFIRRDLDDLQRYGFNWLRVWATWSAFDHDVSAVDTQGAAREPFLTRLRWLVSECDRRGLVVDVTLTRKQRSAKGDSAGGLPDFPSHRRAVETLVDALKPYRNWYIDLANERDVHDARYVSPVELKSLRDLVRRLAPQVLVTASFGGHDLTEDDMRDALFVAGLDFLTPHRPRDAQSPLQTESSTRTSLTLAKALQRPVPIHYQEPFRRGYERWEPAATDFLSDLRGAVSGGAAGWCFHNGSERATPDHQPRRSFDLRAKRLFDQLDPEELKVVSGAKAVLGGRAATSEPPTIPVGLDAYRQWERWPYQRIGARAYMRSTYDRTEGNESADASHFLYQESNTFNVSLDVEGAGVLVFARYNHWHGSPWHYEVDGQDHLVQESSSVDPTKPVSGSVFLPEGLFPNPLTWTWSMTKGADLTWVPIPFERSFRMAYTRTRYGTGYYIFHQYVPGAKLSQPIRAWDARTAPDSSVLELLRRAGTDITPKPQSGVTALAGQVDLAGSAAVTLAIITNGPAMIRAFELSVLTNQAVDFSRAFLRVTWDRRPQPSIEAPVALFFGTGTFYNRDGREYLVKAFPVHVKYEGERVRMACYFPMPFFQEAKFELVGSDKRDFSSINWSVRREALYDPPSHVGYFHSTYRDHPKPELGRDLELLDTRQVEGGGDWTGSFVGTSFIFTHRNELSTLEGDPRFFFDDSQSPQAYGTGTEEWCGGGDYWGGLNMTLPFAGHPVGARNMQEAKNEEDKIHSAYRFLLADLMPFGKNAVIHLEHGGLNESTEHYQTVAYWYGAPAASLVKTDQLDVGDLASERAHNYFSPGASEPYAITSRYEWGPDTYVTGPNGEILYPLGFRSLTQPDLPNADKAKLVVAFPAHKEKGRQVLTRSEFTLKIAPKNVGVMLRRTLDYQFPNQRAKIFIADASTPGRAPEEAAWQPAGVWYSAGANTCIYSDPKGELGETLHHVETSNRRFRDDEFLVPRALTEGRAAIRVRVEFTPVQRPLFPGYPVPELAWSELRYEAYCFVMPAWSPTPKP